MSAPNYIALPAGNVTANRVITASKQLTTVMATIEELKARFGKSIADDATGGTLATQLGIADADTALAVYDLISDLNDDLVDGAKNMVTFRARINRDSS